MTSFGLQIFAKVDHVQVHVHTDKNNTFPPFALHWSGDGSDINSAVFWAFIKFGRIGLPKTVLKTLFQWQESRKEENCNWSENIIWWQLWSLVAASCFSGSDSFSASSRTSRFLPLHRSTETLGRQKIFQIYFKTINQPSSQWFSNVLSGYQLFLILGGSCLVGSKKNYFCGARCRQVRTIVSFFTII